MSDADFLRQFYDILMACNMNPPPWEAWRDHAMDNAELWPIEGGGKMVGGVFWKGHTVHIAVLPEWRGRWMKRRHLEGWRKFTHEADIYATPLASDKPLCSMLERLGFRKTISEGKLGIAGHLAEQHAGRVIYVKDRTVTTPTEEPCLQF